MIGGCSSISIPLAWVQKTHFVPWMKMKVWSKNEFREQDESSEQSESIELLLEAPHPHLRRWFYVYTYLICALIYNVLHLKIVEIVNKTSVHWSSERDSICTRTLLVQMHTSFSDSQLQSNSNKIKEIVVRTSVYWSSKPKFNELTRSQIHTRFSDSQLQSNSRKIKELQYNPPPFPFTPMNIDVMCTLL